MKAIMTTTLMVLMATATKAQDNSVSPYAIFGDTTAVLTAELPQASAMLVVPIATDDSQTATAVFDFLHRQAFLYDNQGQLIVADTLFEGQKGIWQNVDPKAGDYPHVTPYGYCIGNPVIQIDPDGRKVKVAGLEEMEMIARTLPEEARQYVKIGKNGFIDKSVLSQYTGNDYNAKCLMELVSNPMTLEVSLDNQYEWLLGNSFADIIEQNEKKYSSPYPMEPVSISSIDFLYNPFANPNDLSTREEGSLGKTLFPDLAGYQNSPDGNVKVIVNSSLSLQGRAEVYSHEANGHVLLYFRSAYNHNSARHRPKGMNDLNWILSNMIEKSKTRTIINNRR